MPQFYNSSNQWKEIFNNVRVVYQIIFGRQYSRASHCDHVKGFLKHLIKLWITVLLKTYLNRINKRRIWILIKFINHNLQKCHQVVFKCERNYPHTMLQKSWCWLTYCLQMGKLLENLLYKRPNFIKYWFEWTYLIFSNQVFTTFTKASYQINIFTRWLVNIIVNCFLCQMLLSLLSFHPIDIFIQRFNKFHGNKSQMFSAFGLIVITDPRN